MSELSELRSVVVRSVGPLRKTASGHPYIEAETDEGIAAFWGFRDEMSNIAAIQSASLPATHR